jgi:hypothetical protein
MSGMLRRVMYSIQIQCPCARGEEKKTVGKQISAVDNSSNVWSRLISPKAVTHKSLQPHRKEKGRYQQNGGCAANEPVGWWLKWTQPGCGEGECENLKRRRLIDVFEPALRERLENAKLESEGNGPRHRDAYERRQDVGKSASDKSGSVAETQAAANNESLSSNDRDERIAHEGPSHKDHWNARVGEDHG